MKQTNQGDCFIGQIKWLFSYYFVQNFFTYVFLFKMSLRLNCCKMLKVTTYIYYNGSKIEVTRAHFQRLEVQQQTHTISFTMTKAKVYNLYGNFRILTEMQYSEIKAIKLCALHELFLCNSFINLVKILLTTSNTYWKNKIVVSFEKYFIKTSVAMFKTSECKFFFKKNMMIYVCTCTYVWKAFR